MTCDCQKLREVAKIVDYTERSRGYPMPNEWAEIVRVARQSLAQSPAAPSDDVDTVSLWKARVERIEAFAREVRADALEEIISDLEQFASNLSLPSERFMVNRCIGRVDIRAMKQPTPKHSATDCSGEGECEHVPGRHVSGTVYQCVKCYEGFEPIPPKQS